MKFSYRSIVSLSLSATLSVTSTCPDAQPKGVCISSIDYNDKNATMIGAMIKVEGADCSIMSHLTGLDVERCCITQVTNGPDHRPAPVGTIITIPRKSVVYGTLNHPLKHPNQDCVPATGA
ncbi:hypothetical protein H4Q26_007112 [Puccinia striiformis f. sp. tritici PST-130]|nr:hypothetical protein Pst134EB_003792 [Puccinia striiformis f. sp. tritici]KAI9610113.1 hypothetical protein H4Q26_007112 [Puccinia striiformis f. sp. tritici PST-130]